MGSQEQSVRTRILAVTGVALILRTVFAFIVPVVPTNSDPSAYVRFARNIVAGDGFGWGPGVLTAFWPPGPSALYAAVFRIFGDHLFMIAAIHVLLGTASVALFMVIASRRYPAAVATCGGALLAVWPLLIQFTTIPSSEPLFLFLLLVAVWVWGHGSTAFWKRGAICGVIFAAASLTRPTGLLLMVVLGGAELLRNRKLLPPLLTALTSALVMLLLLAPWALRNQHVLGRAFLTSSSGSANTWLGNNNRLLPPGEMWPPEVREMSEAQRADYLSAEVRRFISENPAEFARRTAVRFFRVHERESIGVVWNDKSLEARGIGARGQLVIKVLSNVFWWSVLALAIVGLCFSVKSRGFVGTLADPLIALWLYFAVVHAVTVVQDRYHYPFIPSVAAMAALSIVHFRGGRSGQPSSQKLGDKQYGGAQ